METQPSIDATVTLTVAESQWTDWALDSLADYWIDSPDGPELHPDTLPRVDNRKLIFSHTPVLCLVDLIDEVTQHAPMVVEQGAGTDTEERRELRTLRNVASKLTTISRGTDR